MQEFQNSTPLMKQFLEIKKNFQDTILLFQVGDFYELFFEDAKTASAVLSIALTKRGNINGEPIPLCGVPIHVIDHHLTKLIKAGYKVAICNQLEEPVPGKVVRRGVVQVLTPGTLTDCKLLNEKSASHLLSLFADKNNWGLVFVEILTAKIYATIIPVNSFKMLESELVRFFPDEILLSFDDTNLENYFKKLGYFVTKQFFENDNEIISLVKKLVSDDQFLFKNESLFFSFCNFIKYLKKNQETSVEHFKKINYYKPDDFLVVDASTQKNLELVKNSQDSSSKNTLFWLLDKAITPMGSRTIKKWIIQPLVQIEKINERYDAIEFLINNISLKEKLIECLKRCSDLERIVGRIALKKAHLNDYLSLLCTISIIPQIKKLILNIENIKLLNFINQNLNDFNDLINLLSKSLNEDTSKDWIIKKGYDPNLDKLRDLVEHSGHKILQLEQKEIQQTGISSLKIRYNNIYGYYIEITKSNLSLVPSHYVRQQTLSGKERYITKELQQLQIQIDTAHKEIKNVEQNIFASIKNYVDGYLTELRINANCLSILDAIIGFTNIAYENSYVRPSFNFQRNIIIDQGRHPIIEQVIGKKFISNSINLNDQESLLIITGPNMGGKSTYLRQTALICLMAQCGSFVPAKSACLPILDKIFTRIGAGDNLAEGKSTFLVEMEETANICNQATKNSLVILDEVGRGTSTLDGLAIAKAVIEYIYNNIQARCLFATHYHELTSLEIKYKGISSYFAASKKDENGIVFFHKIIKGAADSSFGIEIAKLANLPEEIILNSQQILDEINAQKQINFLPSGLENNLKNVEIKNLRNEIKEQNIIISKLKKLDLEELTPKKAFDFLWSIKEML